MFDLSAFSAQVVIDHQILRKLRQQSLQSADIQSLGSTYSFSELLEAQIGYHLRGLDLGAKEEVKHAVLNRILENPSEINISQKDLAEMILALSFPLERRIKNLQNWVTLSTDFTLNFEEVSIVTRAYDIEVDYEDELKVNDSDDMPFDLSDKKGNRYDAYVDKNTETEAETVSALESITDSPDSFVWEDAPEKPEWMSLVNDWLEKNAFWRQLIQYKKMMVVGGKLVFLMGLTALAVFVFGQFFLPKTVPFIFTDACHLVKQANHKPFPLEIASRVSFDEITQGMPSSFEYRQINVQRLKGYLKRKNSILANEPYFSEVLKTAAINNVNPALMFAITGQEQGFVRSDDPDVELIANNPFNVYHSWKDYNTNIADSADVAAKTIIEVSRKKPNKTNVFKWLNQKYAEDKNWWIGVEYFFFDIENYIH